MENYLMVNGQKIPLTEVQVAQITGGQEKKEEKVALEKLNPGDVFRIGSCEFLVLEQTGNATAVIKKDFLVAKAEFGENNNYAESPIRAACEEFAAGIAQEIGDENILEHTVDLTANDGLKDYGGIKARASLLTAERYRNRYPKKYRHSLGDRIQLKSLDLYETLLEANRIDNRIRKWERCETITRAITYCDELLFYIELSMNLKLLSDNSAEYWSKMVRDVKHMSLAWRTRERQ